MATLNERPAGRPPGAPGADTRDWTEESSRASFELLGDRVITATRRWLRSGRRQRLQHDLYTVNGIELSLPQIDALEAVSAEDIRMHELAERLHIDPSTATRTTAPLVDLGLVERQPDPANRRYVIVRCTISGRQAATRIATERRQLMRNVLEPMAPDRRLLFAELLEEYLDLVDTYPSPGDS
jgi:DNA-binding MarR family transcriptional regulator